MEVLSKIGPFWVSVLAQSSRTLTMVLRSVLGVLTGLLAFSAGVTEQTDSPRLNRAFLVGGLVATFTHLLLEQTCRGSLWAFVLAQRGHMHAGSAASGFRFP